MNAIIAISRKMVLAYNSVCKPLCKELGLSQTAFDILMFLCNNPECKTASEIVEIRHIKANLVSINIERLVRDGYIIRKKVKNDRRKTQLICTEKADYVIAKGRNLQKDFAKKLFVNIDADTRKAFVSAMGIIEKNLNEILKEE